MLTILFAGILPFKTTNNPEYLIVLLVVVVVIILLCIYNSWNDSKNLQKKGGKPWSPHDTRVSPDNLFANHSSLGPDKKDLKYVIRLYGFNKDQEDFFTRLCNGNKIRNPSRLLQEQKEFDDFCNKVFMYLQIQHIPAPEIEKQKTLLFTIRESVENYKNSEKNITSTRAIRHGQQFTLTTKEDEQYPMSVLENTQEGLSCAIPLDISGKELKIPLGARIKIFFYSGTGEAYQLTSKVRRYQSSTTATRIIIAHTDAIKMLPNRNHARKMLNTACLFSPVATANVVTGKRTEHKFFPSGKNFEGSIIDISAGGCSIKTVSPLADGEYLQIRCMLDKKNEDTMIAKVVKHRINEPDRKTVMHIQFAKIPRTTMNRIFSFIYNYGEQASDNS